MKTGELIKKCRTARNITQEEMASALHVTPQAISRWETSVSYPDITMLPQIAGYLNISMDRLIPCTSIENNAGTKILNQEQIDILCDYVPCQRKQAQRVLVVDDSSFMRSMLADILASGGHRIMQASNGMECLEVLATTPIDICMLDIQMPVMDGMQALKIIKEQYPQTKIIILSIQCTTETVRKCLSLGADSFVAKPFAPESILERMG